MQLEIRTFAPFVESAKLPDAEIEAITFEQTLAAALAFGDRRFDRKTLCKLTGLRYQHFAEYIAGTRPFNAKKLARFCMLCGCAYPKQWLEIQERREEEEYRKVSNEAVCEYLQRAMKAA